MLTLRYPLVLLLQFYFLIPHSSASESTTTESPPRQLLDKLIDMKQRALDWITHQRKPDYGWGTDTARVIISLSPVIENWAVTKESDMILIAKQLEVELLAKLLRNSEERIPPARLAYYILALNAICRDPRDYYGQDLVGMLGKHTADSDYPGYPESYGLSLSSLVSCLGGTHLHRRQIHHLIKIVRDESRLDSIEMRAMALLALKCVYEERGLEGVHRILQEGYAGLGALQKSDGSFGNIHTTALIIQGLGRDDSLGESWNDTSGILGLASLQNSDGSFGDNILGTSDGLLAISSLLNGSGILKLKRHQCSSHQNQYKDLESIISRSHAVLSSTTTGTVAWNNSEQRIPIDSEGDKGPRTSSPLLQVTKGTSMDGSSSSPSPPVVDPVPTSGSQFLSIKYSLWIGGDPSSAERHNLTMSVPLNTSFFHVMQRAAELDPAFEFTSTLWPNGHYVHTISGHREQPVGYNYWLLYRLPTDPDPMNPPPTTYVAEKGVDDLIVQDGDIYLFWFKKI